jgi:hypothetical protein
MSCASWALLLGMFLLQIGNGLQGSLMGVRGAIEGFTTVELSMIASAYFVGFLGGSRIAPKFIARVGHVRVFAALGSLISAVLIAYPVLTDPYAWMVLRVIIGFSLSGSMSPPKAGSTTRPPTRRGAVAVGLHAGADVRPRGRAGHPERWRSVGLPAVHHPSILVSLSFAPILLSVSPAPSFETSRPMSLAQLYKTSPFGVVGMTLMGASSPGSSAWRRSTRPRWVWASGSCRSSCRPSSSGRSCCNIRSAGCRTGWTGASSSWGPAPWCGGLPGRDRAGPCLPGAAGGRCAVGRAGATALCAPDRLYQRLPRLRGHARRLRGAFVRERDRRDHRAAGDGHSDGGPGARGLLAVHGCGSGRPHRLRALADDAALDRVCRRG